MNDQPILTDATLEAMLARRAGPGAPAGLAESIAAAVETLPEARRPSWTILAPPAGRSQAFRMVWIVAIVGLLLAATASAIYVGSEVLRHTDRTVVPPPVGVLPAQATCPQGSNPDVPGPADQDRQNSPFAEYGSMAFDRHAGRIVVLGTDEQPSPRTWTFDVCTNTWQRMSPPDEPPVDDPVKLVYDADSDLTLAFTSDGRVWSYDLTADKWTKKGQFPEVARGLVGWTLGVAAVYHDPSGRVIVYDGDSIWAYDVETDTMTAVRQLPDPSQPAGAGLPDGVTAVVYDRDRDLLLAAVAVPELYVSNSRRYETWAADAMLEIWAFDPATGSWRLDPSRVPARILWQADGFFYGPVSRVAFDRASGVTVFMSPSGWVEAYDGQRNWRVHPIEASMSDGSGGSWCDTLDPVYDPIHGRIVCQVRNGGVSAFSTASGQWRWLLEPMVQEGT